MDGEYPVLIVRGGIYSACLETVDTLLSGKGGDILYVVIESYGGDPTSGYRIMRLIQAKYKKIVVIIPSEAYSTATLMALGADQIYMRKSACLGPLDIQIKHPTDGSMISSLEIREVLNTLEGSLKTYAEDLFDSLVTTFELGKADAAAIAMKTAADMVKPITEKIDPIYFQSSTRSSKLGQKYAEDLLVSRMMRKQPRLARAVSIYLANNYDYHGYAIMLDEASQTLALNVADVANLDAWKAIQPLYDNSHKKGADLYQVKNQNQDEQKNVQTKGTATAKLKTVKGGKK